MKRPSGHPSSIEKGLLNPWLNRGRIAVILTAFGGIPAAISCGAGQQDMSTPEGIREAAVDKDNKNTKIITIPEIGGTIMIGRDDVQDGGTSLSGLLLISGAFKPSGIDRRYILGSDASPWTELVLERDVGVIRLKMDGSSMEMVFQCGPQQSNGMTACQGIEVNRDLAIAATSAITDGGTASQNAAISDAGLNTDVSPAVFPDGGGTTSKNTGTDLVSVMAQIDSMRDFAVLDLIVSLVYPKGESVGKTVSEHQKSLKKWLEEGRVSPSQLKEAIQKADEIMDFMGQQGLKP